jgi:hypothetical protein
VEAAVEAALDAALEAALEAAWTGPGTVFSVAQGAKVLSCGKCSRHQVAFYRGCTALR